MYNHLSRRSFLKKATMGAAGAFVAPMIVPSTVFGASAPSNRLHIAVIGLGRMGQFAELAYVIKRDDVQVVAVCDVDSKRLMETQKGANNHYTQKYGKPYTDVKGFTNYLELLENKTIDAVMISTPDHQHANITIDAVYAGKDVFLQKPASLTIAEGRAMSNAVNSTGRIFQIGSQQRSSPQFRIACELVRNGRIGELKTVEVRLPGDPPGGNTQEMPIPPNLNYDAWLGSTPWVYYTEDRVHSQNGGAFTRPGWLRCEQFGAGMITGWGTHHFDIAHWGMGTEYTGPVEISAKAEFPAPGSGLWDVHGKFHSEMLYANGVRVYGMEDGPNKPNGVLFTGTEGWIFVCRGEAPVTSSDPKIAGSSKSLQASNPKILTWEPGPNDIQLEVSNDHYLNWLDAVRTRKQPITNAEIAHRSCSACLLQHIAMKLHRKLHWDPVRERFHNDDEANAMLSRPQRYPYNMK